MPVPVAMGHEEPKADQNRTKQNKRGYTDDKTHLSFPRCHLMQVCKIIKNNPTQKQNAADAGKMHDMGYHRVAVRGNHQEYKKKRRKQNKTKPQLTTVYDKSMAINPRASLPCSLAERRAPHPSHPSALRPRKKKRRPSICYKEGERCKYEQTVT